MSEYKELLNKMKVSELKQIIRAYMKDVKITMNKKKKNELIAVLLEHTDLIDGEITTKKIEIDIDDIINEKEKKHIKKEKKHIKKETKNIKKETKNIPEYKVLNNRYNEIQKELEHIETHFKEDPEPRDLEKISFIEGRKKYGVKNKKELLDKLHENNSIELKKWRERNYKLIQREKDLMKEADLIFEKMRPIPFSRVLTDTIAESSLMLLKYMGAGVLDPYEKKQMQYYNDKIKEYTDLLNKYYPEIAKEQK